AEAAQIGRVAVATDTPEIAAVVTAHGGEAVMTRSEHPSGSDRIYEALGKLDPHGAMEIVVNLQGDFPTIRPENIRSVLGPLADPEVDIATLAAEIHVDEERTNPNVVKMVGAPVGARRCSVSLRSPPRRWNGARNSSSFGRWRPACGSMSPSSTRCPAASTPPPTSNPPDRYWRKAERLLQGAP